MTKKESAALTAEQQASYQQMADLAESESTPAAAKASAQHGTNAAAQARAMLAAAGMDPAELNRLIGGRPSVDPESEPGKKSPQLNLRVSADLKKELKALADERKIRPSELARELLTAGVHELRRSGAAAHKREKHPA